MTKTRLLLQSLWFKLTASFLAIAIFGVLVVAVQADQATETYFSRYLSQDASTDWEPLRDALATLYGRQQNWNGASSILQSARRGQGGLQLVLVDAGGKFIAATSGRFMEIESAGEPTSALPILWDGDQVGTLQVMNMGFGNSPAASEFLTAVNDAIWLGGITAILLALILGALVASQLTRPLRQLTAATHALAAGKLEQAVPIQSRDEIGQLAQSFNQTAAALADAEIVRRQMLADIAHELRTPISVMRSHVEAMLDGVFETSPENLGVIHEETVLLGRLVDDLRILSLADAGQLPLKLERLNVKALLQQALMAFEPLAEADDVLIMEKIAGDLPAIIGDPARLQQVLGNLITNALRHVRQGTAVTPTITLEAIAAGPGVQIGVKDNGPGLSEISRTRVFDRFWRADNARSRDQGGSGLGLAISQAIISSHQGQIWVESNPTQGSAFYFTLPRETAANNEHG